MDKRFLAMATKLNHDIRALEAGGQVTSSVVVHSVEELRDLLHDRLDPQSRRIRAEVMKSAAATMEDVKTDASPQGIMNRVQSYIYADEPLGQEDRSRIQSLFPMSVQAISSTTKTLGPGEVWHLGTSTTPVVVNLDTLIMQPGSSIDIHNTVLDFTVGTLVRNTGPTPVGPGYDLAIFGVDGLPGANGAMGPQGGPGVTGGSGTCQSPGVAGAPSGPGATGNQGYSGGQGGTGGDGLPALPASVKIGHGGIVNSAGQPSVFVIYTRSGAGGPGATCGCEGTNGGNGGAGGKGGTGGTGGQGGKGVDGNTITVIVPQGQKARVKTTSALAPAGQGGLGGLGGVGGDPGAGGTGGKHSSDGMVGLAGDAGNVGTNGIAGSTYGKPGVIQVTEHDHDPDDH